METSENHIHCMLKSGPIFCKTACLALIHALYISLPLAMALVAVSFTGNSVHAFLVTRKIVAVLPLNT